MRIKHFAGYGIIEAKKVSVKTENGVRTLVIKVKGNHEWGINREMDSGCIYTWLVKKFDKTLPDDFNYYRACLHIIHDIYDNYLVTGSEGCADRWRWSG